MKNKYVWTYGQLNYCMLGAGIWGVFHHVKYPVSFYFNPHQYSCQNLLIRTSMVHHSFLISIHDTFVSEYIDMIIRTPSYNNKEIMIEYFNWVTFWNIKMTPIILCSEHGRKSKIVYTDPIVVPNQIIFSPGDGMCRGDNYIKREKKITHWSENIVTNIPLGSHWPMLYWWGLRTYMAQHLLLTMLLQNLYRQKYSLHFKSWNHCRAS